MTQASHEVQYVWSDRTVRAMCDGRKLGNITVPDIHLHWGAGVFVPVAGIAAVGTEETARRSGVGAGMMRQVLRFARAEGYTCSAVSTAHTNIARRLYARAGNVTLFSLHRFLRTLARRKPPAPPVGVTVRTFRKSDLASVLDLIRRVERPFFGSARKIDREWRDLHFGKGAPPVAAFVARREGRIVAFADRFKQWEDVLSGELFIDPSERAPSAIAALLLALLENAVLDAGETDLSFWATECETFLLRLLDTRGYRRGQSHVFMLNILDLDGLLDVLRPAFLGRAAALDRADLPSRLEFVAPEHAGGLDLPGDLPPISLETDRPTLTRVLTGARSAWEAYLRGDLHIRPSATPSATAAVQTLLPVTPFHHPANDWR